MEHKIIEKLRRLLIEPTIEVDFTAFMFALVISFLTAGLISTLYKVFYENKATGAQIHRSFSLLGPSITALFIAVQFSLPLSLGLLGALSIIRFRTPVKEPEEVGFIMLLIASSVVCATFHFFLLGALLGVVTSGLVARRFTRIGAKFSGKRNDGILVFVLAGVDVSSAQKRIGDIVSALTGVQLQSISVTNEEIVIQYSFSGASSQSLSSLSDALKEFSELRRYNVFYNKQGVLF